MPYESPILAKLTPEEAKLKLVCAESSGNQAAKDFLDKILPDSIPVKKSAMKKPA